MESKGLSCDVHGAQVKRAQLQQAMSGQMLAPTLCTPAVSHNIRHMPPVLALFTCTNTLHQVKRCYPHLPFKVTQLSQINQLIVQHVNLFVFSVPQNMLIGWETRLKKAVVAEVKIFC